MGGHAVVTPRSLSASDDRFETFRRILIERGDDREAYLVLADHLQELGDPRGELIALEHQAETEPQARAAATRHFQAHRAALLGPLAGAGDWLSAVRWRLGFVERARLRFAYDAPSDAVRRGLRAVLDAPAMALLHRLELEVEPKDEGGSPKEDLDGVVLAALCARPLPSLRTLSLSVLGAGRVSFKLLRDALPNLETLSVRSQRMSFSGVKSWGVRALTLFTRSIPVASFRGADWSALESLSLTAELDGSLTELLRATPALRAVAIATGPNKVDVVGSLLLAGLAPKLKRLRLAPTAPSELKALVQNAALFEALERLEVTLGRRELSARFGRRVMVGEPMEDAEAEDRSLVEYE